MSDLLSGIAHFTKTVADSFNTYEIRKLGDKVQGMVMNYTEAESKVREATNEDPWGPTGPQMAEIAHMTYQYDAFPEIMSMLWKRMLQDNRNAWRRSLTLLHYLLRNGSERVVSNARDHLFEMRTLESYKFMDEKGKDQGLNVRHRATVLFDLIQDDEKLKAERKKAKLEGKEKYQGYSKDDLRLGMGGYSFFRSSGPENFNDWKTSNQFSKKRNSFDDDGRDAYHHREVNSFQFPDEEISHGGGDSPELGIRERSPEPTSQETEDDEFGNFALARNTRSHKQLIHKVSPTSIVTSQSETVHKSYLQPTSNVSIPAVIPPPPPPSSNMTALAMKHATLESSVSALDQPSKDLLKLDVFSETGKRKSSFSKDSLGLSPDLQSSSFVKVMNEGVSLQQPNSPLCFEHLSFESLPDTAFSINDNQGIFTTLPSMTSDDYTAVTSTPVFAHSAVPVSLIDSTALWSSASRTSVSLPDTFVQSPPHSNILTTASTPLTPVPAHCTSTASQKSSSSSSQIGQLSKSPVKIPSTWADASNKVNIDLDNLGIKKTPLKQSIPMNQMITSLSTPKATDRNSVASPTVFTNAAPFQVSADKLDLLK
ncbi:unnamed protein product [Thelazia callipaeda]|uniref:ENTH domain-containing protein n=1 Tax=Thelazia callipaeda TaxID=103827 RepID=A0A0N5D1U8_THECL|nr:unnamed protein product [Thelazia callipaeda]